MVNSKLKYFKFVYYLTCILSTLCLSMWCVYEYSLDEDLTRIRFRRFTEDYQDVYPSVSFCFFNPYLFEKLEMFGNDITESKYIKFLQGKLWDDKLARIDYDKQTKARMMFFLVYKQQHPVH